MTSWRFWNFIEREWKQPPSQYCFRGEYLQKWNTLMVSHSILKKKVCRNISIRSTLFSECIKIYKRCWSVFIEFHWIKVCHPMNHLFHWMRWELVNTACLVWFILRKVSTLSKFCNRFSFPELNGNPWNNFIFPKSFLKENQKGSLFSFPNKKVMRSKKYCEQYLFDLKSCAFIFGTYIQYNLQFCY